MVFRAFLQRDQRRPRRMPAHLLSVALHGLGLLALVLSARLLPEEQAAPPAPARQPALAVSLFRPHLAASAAPAPAFQPPQAARARPRPRRPSGPSPADTAAPVSAAVSGASALREALSGLGSVSGGQNTGPPGEGTGAGGRRRTELFARVIGSGIARGASVRTDYPFVSLQEATALRIYDYFPRLPAALWSERRPYVVAIELCVSSEGRVSEAALRSHRAPHLDQLVLDAVRSWRYHPRLEGGHPAPFCHGVAIKYEPSYF